MKRCLIAGLLLLCAGALLFAQADEYPEDEIAQEGYDYLRLRRGDQTIKISLGVDVPLWMHGAGTSYYPSNIYVGGTGSIGYNYYLAGGFSIGGDINFQFNTTRAGNVLFKLPIMIRPSYTFTVWRIQIPVSIGLGATFESYDGNNYFNVSIQPEIAAYYVINEEWSLGVAVSYDFIPQWYSDSSYNRFGHFLNTCVSLRYHF